MKINLRILISGLASLLLGLGGYANANITSVSPGSITNGSGSVTFSDYGGTFSATAADYTFGSLAPATISLGWTGGGETDFAGGLRLVLTTINNSGTPWGGFDFSIPTTGPVVLYSGDAVTPGIGTYTAGTYSTNPSDTFQAGANPNITADSYNYNFTFSSQVNNSSSFSTYLPLLFSGTPGSEGTISLTLSPIAAIPEPEIYAMMGFGLLLMGFVARRRRQQGLT